MLNQIRLALSVVGLAVVFIGLRAGGAQSQADDLLKPEQLEQLTAPIALYPDPLLAEILMASTYPLEVIEGYRWQVQNKNWNQIEHALQLERKRWDQSVRSLLAIPDVLSIMSFNLRWTQDLGDAILAQPADVLGAVQRMRARALDQNRLVSNKHQTVSEKRTQESRIITIEPKEPDRINVPIYDPVAVFAPWPYPDHPPSFLPWTGDTENLTILPRMAFSAGYSVARWAIENHYWGGGINWQTFNINANRPITLEPTVFEHDPEHRRGVRYRSESVRQRYRGLRTDLPAKTISRSL